MFQHPLAPLDDLHYWIILLDVCRREYSAFVERFGQHSFTHNECRLHTMAKTEAISIRVEPDVKAAAKKAADDDRRTVAALVEKILVEYLAKNGYLKSKR